MPILKRIPKEAPPAMSEHEMELARVAQRCIMEALDHSRAVSITLSTETGLHPSIEVPPAALKLIGQLLGAMSEGKTVVLMPDKQEFTTVEAANYLNVSRPFVIKEIEEGRIKHRMVGTHRRIALEDLLAYERGMRERQSAALDRMAENARDLGLDY
ncbi:excisionase family DNA-binding protein [Paraburkholderia silviterrae]|uniref:Helix-turn-helix domain-containing protein n=1 Tax=Paraburkholderia silviterrae TaxID=2528715 RepID=A0A4R5M6S9_9BURK|nr:excisionase family DNA-binding protein [Paraburkholderia silviterrae]TDG21418.1 helix-turn-helix domain-containing protein [Paraburkholderia silviterrae]